VINLLEVSVEAKITFTLFSLSKTNFQTGVDNHISKISFQLLSRWIFGLISLLLACNISAGNQG
jgi:hypothetical protein